MRIAPTPDYGGRLIEGQTPHGDYHIEVFHDFDGPVYDADGNHVADLRMVIKSPPPPEPKQFTATEKARLARRIKACAGCECLIRFGQGIVHCKKVECKTCPQRKHAMDMVQAESTCPLNRWGAE